MSAVTVTGCGDCPFHNRRVAAGYPYVCTHPVSPDSAITERSAPPPPKWCPLRQGPTTIELALDVPVVGVVDPCEDPCEDPGCPVHGDDNQP